MKILIFAIGSRGDVQPYVVLGRELIARGHDVHIAAPPGYDDMIAAVGAVRHTLPADFQSMVNDPEIQSAITSWRGRLRAYRLTADIMNEQLSAIWRIGLDVAPDVILNHFKAALAPNLARKLGAVSIPVMLQPGFVPTRAYPQFFFSSWSLGGFANLMTHRAILALTRFGTRLMIRRWLKQTGTDIGPPMDHMAAYSPHGSAPRVHAYSRIICPRPDEWPATEVQTGYFFTESQPFEPPAGLSQFLEAEPQPLYVGFGSMPGIDPARTSRAVLGALARTGQRAVVATGWGGIRQMQSSDNVYVLDAVPHTWLFPKVAAVVHHGGSGTTHEALRWGRPSIVCPVFADQPFFGRCVAELGAGPQPIAQKRLTEERLATALEFALTDAVRRRAEAAGREIRSENGTRRAADLIEHCCNDPGCRSSRHGAQ